MEELVCFWKSSRSDIMSSFWSYDWEELGCWSGCLAAWSTCRDWMSLQLEGEVFCEVY